MISYRQADLLQNMLENVPSVTVYFQTADPASAENGDFASQGVEEEHIADWSKDIGDLAQWAIDQTEQYKPLEYSDSEPDFNTFDGWFRSVDAIEDYQTGTETTYEITFKNFTPEQNQRIYQALTSQ